MPPLTKLSRVSGTARRLALLGAVCWFVAGRAAAQPDEAFVDVGEAIPGIALDIRYATPHNFIGRPIPGYERPVCLLTAQAAAALERVQAVLREFGLGLQLYDCYRPQRAVDAFVVWARDLDDEAMKAEFYPTVEKQNLFRDGYIAARSGHSRGSTVDLTIVPFAAPPLPAFETTGRLRSCESPVNERFPDRSLDMGTGYDCFSQRSHTSSLAVGAGQRANRLLLKSIMEANGFVNLAEEWWHFTLADEPFPDTYFDFPVE